MQLDSLQPSMQEENLTQSGKKPCHVVLHMFLFAPLLYIRFSLFLLWNLLQLLLDPFLAALRQPGVSCQPLWQGNVPASAYPAWEIPPRRKSPASHAHTTLLLHPAISSHMSQHSLTAPVNQGWKISGVWPAAIKRVLWVLSLEL